MTVKRINKRVYGLYYSYKTKTQADEGAKEARRYWRSVRVAYEVYPKAKFWAVWVWGQRKSKAK